MGSAATGGVENDVGDRQRATRARLTPTLEGDSLPPGSVLDRDHSRRDVTEHLGDLPGDAASDMDPDVIASLLVEAADGLQIQWLLDPGRPTWAPVQELLTTLLDAATSREILTEDVRHTEDPEVR